ncbi:uncharacterized protein PG986_008544 [Apiospora aurea]|uniref:Chromatin target of PRMT1 protein C-terminal domain-containing protein n=1 Tax=Apiospora aurea TaxID=335848 RepID=A0ABR1QGI4_9PEZI
MGHTVSRLPAQTARGAAAGTGDAENGSDSSKHVGHQHWTPGMTFGGLFEAKDEPDIEANKYAPQTVTTTKTQRRTATNGTKRVREEDATDIATNHPIPQRRRLEEPSIQPTPTVGSQYAAIDEFTFPRPDTMIATVPNDNARRAAVNMFFNRQSPEYPFSFEMRMRTRPPPFPSPITSFDLTSNGMTAAAWGYDGLRATIDDLAEKSAIDDKHTLFHVQVSGVTPDDRKHQVETIQTTTNRLSYADTAAKTRSEGSTKKNMMTNNVNGKAKTRHGAGNNATKPTAAPRGRNALRTLDGNTAGRQKTQKDKKNQVLRQLDQDMYDYWAHGPVKEDKDIKVEED